MKPIFLGAILAVFSIATPAMACLNDRETFLLERMFRSSYQSPANPRGEEVPDSQTLPSTYQWNWWAVGASAVGILMFAGSVRIGKRRLAAQG